jgi:hypothetical protein
LRSLSNGDLVLSGTFMDSLVLDGTHLFTVNSPAQYTYNSYLICLSPSGTLKWSRNFSSAFPNFIEPCLLAEDPSGLLWVSLNDFAAGGTLICLSQTGADSVLRNWPNDLTVISDMEFDSQGALYISGSLGQDNFIFWTLPVATVGAYNTFLAKVDPSGACRWFRSIRDITFAPSYIQVDDRLNVYLAKDLFDSVTVYGNYVAGPQWVYDYLVVKFDSTGQVDWAVDVPDQPTITGDLRLAFADPFSVTEDGFDLLLSSRATVDLGNGIVVGSGSPGSAPGMALVHFNDAGTPEWQLAASGTYGIYPQQIVTDGESGYLAATASGPFRIGPDSILMPPNFTYYSLVTRFNDPVTTGISPTVPKESTVQVVNPSPDGTLTMWIVDGFHSIDIADLTGRTVHTCTSEVVNGRLSVKTSLPAGLYIILVDALPAFKWTVCR